MKRHEKSSAIVIEKGERQGKEVHIPLEQPITIFLNGEQLVTILATPLNLKELAAGFLHTEGIIEKLDELKKITVDRAKGLVWVESKKKALPSELLHKRLLASGCGRGTSFYDVKKASKVASKKKVPAAVLSRLMKNFLRQVTLKQEGGGIHYTALCDENGVICLSEDIGRHNALDKVLGECFLSQISTQGKLIFTTGRISSEMLMKAAGARIPVVVSRSSATSLAVILGKKLNVTVVGYVRAGKITIYTHSARVT